MWRSSFGSKATVMGTGLLPKMAVTDVYRVAASRAAMCTPSFSYGRAAPWTRFDGAAASLALTSSTTLIAPTQVSSQRGIFADKVRSGTILKIDAKLWRVMSSGKSQKGQNAASFHIKLRELVTGRVKEVTSSQGHDFPEAKFERARLLFSGFDDDDNACFVYPQHHADAGKEVNIPAKTLPEFQQKYLCVGMPCDLLHVMAEEEGEVDFWCEVLMPTNHVMTVERLSVKGMYKMATFIECDGDVSVSDNVQLGDKIKVIIRPDGTASFAGKA